MANVIVPFPGASSADVQAMVAKPAEQVLASDRRHRAHLLGVASRCGRADGAVQGWRAAHRGAGALVRRAQCEPGLAAARPRHVADRSSSPRGSTTCRCWPRRCGARTTRRRTIWNASRAASRVELKRVPGTREVQTLGGPGRVVQVALDPTRMMRERGVDVVRLKGTLAAANLGMPVGRGARHPGCGRADAHRGDRRVPTHRRRRGRPGGGRQRGTTGVSARGGARRGRCRTAQDLRVARRPVWRAQRRRRPAACTRR